MAEAFMDRHAHLFAALDLTIKVENRRTDSIEGFTISAEKDSDRVKATIGITLPHALRYGLNALKTWLEQGSQTPLELTDGPDFPVRGVVEGFYGTPWSHSQRLRGIEFFADFGMNTYFLAPKDDPLQRFNWRSPFSSEFLATATELIGHGALHGVDFVACVSPGLSVKYSDQNDVKAVAHRFQQLMGLGATHFGLLWDDIAWELQHPEDIQRYASTAAAHADFTNKVFEIVLSGNSKAKLTVCPMQYSGRGNENYLLDLGRELHSRINLMWTGRQICSEYLDISDAVIFERTTLRPALYWDNFPVNDGSMQGNLYIGPLRGRENGLHRYSAGLLSNPMVQFEASLLPLSTIGDYLWDSQSYDPEISWEIGLKRIYSQESERAALRDFYRTSLGSNVGGDPAPDLRAIFRVGVTAWRIGQTEKAGETFVDAGKAMIHNFTFITDEQFSEKDLVVEILPWLEKYRLGAQVLIELGEFLKMCGFDQDKRAITSVAGAEKKLIASLEPFEAHRKRLFGDQILGPINELRAELQTYA
jgi:hyaluronoglucosaminidase